MKTQPVMIADRRQHLRQGVFAEIENITPSVLRRYGINGLTEQQSPRSMFEKAASLERFCLMQGAQIMTYVMTKPCPVCKQQLTKQRPTDTVPCSCGHHVWQG
jgi:hypothetical protein